MLCFYQFDLLQTMRLEDYIMKSYQYYVVVAFQPNFFNYNCFRFLDFGVGSKISKTMDKIIKNVTILKVSFKFCQFLLYIVIFFSFLVLQLIIIRELFIKLFKYPNFSNPYNYHLSKNEIFICYRKLPANRGFFQFSKLCTVKLHVQSFFCMQIRFQFIKRNVTQQIVYGKIACIVYGKIACKSFFYMQIRFQFIQTQCYITNFVNKL
eukprot:TRINITY_DN1906_c0_g1_i5.p1 TRINITY_DN1906_c0_g1~~TRINITY_DN1906_c0_g1_i5.p1  ORF type:complete len:208 (+),score=-11.39 TRINITY_DN1906_c0_g1_i5:107-730(+)